MSYAYKCKHCPFTEDLRQHHDEYETFGDGTTPCVGSDPHQMRRDWQGGGNGVIVR